jgi:hypothetical protein
MGLWISNALPKLQLPLISTDDTDQINALRRYLLTDLISNQRYQCSSAVRIAFCHSGLAILLHSG